MCIRDRYYSDARWHRVGRRDQASSIAKSRPNAITSRSHIWFLISLRKLTSQRHLGRPSPNAATSDRLDGGLVKEHLVEIPLRTINDGIFTKQNHRSRGSLTPFRSTKHPVSVEEGGCRRVVVVDGATAAVWVGRHPGARPGRPRGASGRASVPVSYTHLTLPTSDLV